MISDVVRTVPHTTVSNNAGRMSRRTESPVESYGHVVQLDKIVDYESGRDLVTANTVFMHGRGVGIKPWQSVMLPVGGQLRACEYEFTLWRN